MCVGIPSAQRELAFALAYEKADESDLVNGAFVTVPLPKADVVGYEKSLRFEDAPAALTGEVRLQLGL